VNRGPNPDMFRFNVLLGLLATGLLLLVAVTGHAQDQRPAEMSAAGDFLATLSPLERDWLREHPVITVVLDPSWPPIEFTDEHGTPSGITADYLRLIEARLGVRFERVPNLSWQESYARLQRGEIDLATSVAVTAERETFWAFTKPYMTIPIVVVTRADVTYIADLRELAGRKVAVVEGNAPSVWIARDFPAIQLVQVKTTQESLALLQRGEVFAAVENMLVVGHYLAGQKMADLKVAGATPYTNAQCMAVRKDWAPLAAMLDKVLDSVSPAEHEAIYRRWLPLRQAPGIDYTRYWPAAVLFAAALLGLVAWNRQLAREITSRKLAEEALRHSQALLQSVTEGASDAIYVKDLQGRYLMFNAAAVQIVGRSREEVLGRDDTALFLPDEARQVMASDRGVMASASVQTSEEAVTAGGVTRTFLTVKGPLRDAQGKVTGMFGIARDITERNQAEVALRRTDRALRLVSACNQKLISASSETELLQAICRIIVEQAGYRMAWIGFAEPNEAKSVRPVAQAGFESGYLDTANITWADTERGRGPTGKAIRTGQPVIARNIPSDPAFEPWRAEAIRRGYASSVSLPLISEGRAFGALMVYAAEPDAFNGEDLTLLAEFASNLAYGLIALRVRAGHERAEAALQETNDRLTAVMENLSEGLIMGDGQGQTIYWNPAALAINGFASLDECRRQLAEFAPTFEMRLLDDDRPLLVAEWPMSRVLRGEELHDCAIRLRRLDQGWEKIIAYSGWLIRRPSGERLAFLSATDITERRQAEEKTRQTVKDLEEARQVLLSVVEDQKESAGQLRKLSAIIVQAPLSVVITDLTGAIEYVNPRFSLVTGYTREEVIGQNPRVLKSGETPPETYRAMWQTLAGGGVWTGELSNRTKSGELYRETVVIAPVVDDHGRATHYVAIKDDITAKQRHEAELTDKLAREQELSEMKTRFISVTSHEFRTPMAAAMGSVEILANHLDRLTPEKRRELLDRITFSLHRMTEMLDEILLLNRMDANRVAVLLTPVDLRQFARNVLEEVRLGDRDAHRFEMSATGETAAVVTDPKLLHHILSNLLSNAVRYSPAGTLITLRLAVTAGRTQIAVEDQGIGIPEADRARIFEAFERGSNVGTVKGSGLGLNIVQRMTGLLGGTVALATAAGGGSCFTLDFPPLSTPNVSS